MRSVFVHFQNATKCEIASFLQRTYSFQKGPPWICDIKGDPCLYINFYCDGPQEFEPAEWADLTKSLGGEPTVSIMADVSGRYPGDEQVQSFIATILGEFQGLAQDDYTNHYWTVQEVLSGYRVGGHPFFDYQGWYKEEGVTVGPLGRQIKKCFSGDELAVGV